MGSWVFDLASRRTVWSAGLCRMLGLPQEQHVLELEKLFELVHPDDRERIERLLAAVTARPEAVPEAGIEYTVRMLHADGSFRELRAVVRMETENGRPARWLGAAQDVTEQRQGERALRAHHAVSEALSSWESLELGVVDLLRRVATALEYPMASLWLLESSADVLVCRAFWSAPHVDPGEFEAMKRGVSFRVGEGKPGIAWQTHEPAMTPDIATDPVFRPRDAAVSRGIGSAVAVPAVGPAGPVAVLSFYSFERGAPSADRLRTLMAIGHELGRFLDGRQAELGSRLLTPREIEVLRLAAEGLSGPRIAEQLVLSPATVKKHFEHIYGKLGVGDRAGAVAQAIRTGVIR
ncbi:MAG: two-component system, NtrC family, sensor kinase [Solirubrobacteraceae bacterium]|jgi:PAS domain S-box-containing protein|nr:two-component system, NtrC family, sensor kinase [Solirubrobacteraceae bacterium]